MRMMYLYERKECTILYWLWQCFDIECVGELVSSLETVWRCRTSSNVMAAFPSIPVTGPPLIRDFTPLCLPNSISSPFGDDEPLML
jgi:hypothetical protein